MLFAASFLLRLAFALFGQAPSPPFLISTEAGRDPASALPRWQDLRGLAVDSAGNAYVADANLHLIYRLGVNGNVSLFAGTGAPGFSGDGGPAIQAQLRSPYGIAIGPNGAIYIADLGNARVRRVNPDGRIDTVAGGGTRGASSSGLVATELALQAPRNVAVDRAGILSISDFADHRVLQLSPEGRLLAVVGTGQLGSALDTVAASAATLAFPAGLFAAPDGSLLIADSGNHVIRRFSNGILQMLKAPPGFINLPVAVVADTAGNQYILSAGYDQVAWISANGTSAQVVTGTTASRDLGIDGSGSLYIAGSSQIRRLSPGGASTILSNGIGTRFGGDGGPAAQALLSNPRDVQPDGQGGWLIADTANHRIRRISPAGVITTIAGTGEAGNSGDGGPATSAALHSPQAVLADNGGSIYIADTGNHRIRRILPSGILLGVVGTGNAGLNGEAVAVINAQLSAPSGLALEPGGALLIADTGNNRVRRLGTDGFLITLAGAAGAGSSGDNVPAYTAPLNAPRGIVRSAAGDIFVSDSGNRRIRRITPQHLITTVAEGVESPWGLALDANYSLYFTDTARHQLRRITAAGVTEVLAGSTRGFTGDGGAATEAQLDTPAGFALAGDGSIWVADSGNHRIRKLATKPAATTPVTPTIPPALLPPAPTTPVTPPPVPVDPPATEPTPTLRLTHAASLSETALAPGLLVNIEGTGIGPTAPQGARVGPNGALETTLGGVQVRIDSIAAPLLYAQKDLLQVQAPYRLPLSGTVPVEVLRNGQVVRQATATVTRVAPGVFIVTGTGGQVAATHEDGSANSPGTPAAAGSVLTFRLTGEGRLDPVLEEGRFAETAPYPKPAASVSVTVGAVERVEIVSMAAAVLSPGVLQISIRVPASLAPGQHRLLVHVDGTASQLGAGIWVK